MTNPERLAASVRSMYGEFAFPSGDHNRSFLESYIFPYVPTESVRILDAGCGTGNVTVEVARKHPKAYVIGVDFSENSLRRARQLAQELDVPNVSFRYHDLMLEFPQQDRLDAFDTALSIGCLHHTADPATGLRNLRGVLSPHGMLIVGVYGKYGRIETEMRRDLMGLLRSITGSSSRDSIELCAEVLSEPALRMNSFYKLNTSLMPLTDPGRFISNAKRTMARTLRLRRSVKSIPWDIGMADQYLNPLVHNWTAGQWIDAVETAGLRVEGFVFDSSSGGICIPKDAIVRIKTRRLRMLLNRISIVEQYKAFDLIFRPSMHFILCKVA